MIFWAKHFLVSIFLFTAVFSSAKELREEEQFLADAAYERMMGASTQEDFSETAKLYRKLIASGVRNGTVFYNLGTALLAAGDANSAIEAFKRAERYKGFQSDIADNMLMAQRIASGDSEAVLPWQRTLLFWHYGLSFKTRVAIAALAFSLFWISLIWHSPSSGRRSPTLLLAAFFFILFGSSAITSVAHEHADRQMDYAIAFEQHNPEVPRK